MEMPSVSSLRRRTVPETGKTPKETGKAAPETGKTVSSGMGSIL